jgi:hypothetical protein
MSDATRDPSIGGPLWLFSTGVTLISNLIPLVGVLYWQWDTFQLLMLYWMETVILAFWTMLRLARLPPGHTGNMTVNGVERPATSTELVRFFSAHAGMFIAAHLLFLWALFSSEWLKKVHGVGSFFYELLVTNGLWFALLFFLVAGWVAYLTDDKPEFQQRLDSKLESKLEIPLVTFLLSKWLSFRPGDKPALERRLQRILEPTQVAEGTRRRRDDSAVGAVVGALYLRIGIMQVAIIFGAWFAEAIGSLAPLLLVIILKTVIDLGVGSYISLGKGATYSSGDTSISG